MIFFCCKSNLWLLVSSCIFHMHFLRHFSLKNLARLFKTVIKVKHPSQNMILQNYKYNIFSWEKELNCKPKGLWVDLQGP